ncbi:unnamed protein product [Callosobruchus maculatus]|uniref:Uncharacterized protein n=1 Tax=Callosobruchus maculatus TaxID=64391 RepID=A0A653C8D2_CALMS|nr:unnamed protein product [Callosobruchus maculatus]
MCNVKASIHAIYVSRERQISIKEDTKHTQKTIQKRCFLQPWNNVGFAAFVH